MNLLVYFVIYGHSWCFESSQIALAYGSGNSENCQNITCAHTSSKCTVNETDVKENSNFLIKRIDLLAYVSYL